MYNLNKLIERVIEIVRGLKTKAEREIIQTEWTLELAELKAFAEGQLVVRSRPLSLAELVRSTKFTRKELQVMYRNFKQTCPSGVFSRQEFHNLFGYLFPQGDPSYYADSVFDRFDVDNNGHINFEEYIRNLSIVTRGTINEKMDWVFTLYDPMNTGQITKQRIHQLLYAMSAIMGERVSPPISEEDLWDHTEEVYRKLDMDADGFISREDFIGACEHDEIILKSITELNTVYAV